MGNNRVRIFGINRHRLYTDGPGITTLVAMLGCPLKCKYCINKEVYEHSIRDYTITELYNILKLDNLYFNYTGGGVCFGGHEPLLQSEFINNFIDYLRLNDISWKIGIETSLSRPNDYSDLFNKLDFLIIDIKSLNPDIYKSYTGKSIENLLINLDYISKNIDKSKVKLRVPLIPAFNNEEDIKNSVNILVNTYGFDESNIEIFEYKL